jgi:hypothetical protein
VRKIKIEKTQNNSNLLENYVPKTNFFSDKIMIERGECVDIGWNVVGADNVRFWSTPVLPFTTKPIDWLNLFRIGAEVKVEDKIEVYPSETTAYFLVAQGPLGMSGRQIVVEVPDIKKRAIEKPPHSYKCMPIEKMASKPHIAWVNICRHKHTDLKEVQIVRPVGILMPIRGSPTPTINLSSSNDVIFNDESATISWNISNATCIDYGLGFAGGGCPNYGCYAGGGTPACVMPNVGQITVELSNLTSNDNNIRHGIAYFGIDASNSMGGKADADLSIGILSLPKFSGASNQKRINEVKNAIKTIFRALLNYCILSDTTLDNSVAAFKDGHLKRTDVYWNLRKEINCMELNTINCKDVSDQDFDGGDWDSKYPNVIGIEWSPNHLPCLEYVILHELTHKIGFNEYLLQWYDRPNIEMQTYKVASACYPCI